MRATLLTVLFLLSACGAAAWGDDYLLRGSDVVCVTYPCPTMEAVPLHLASQAKPVTDVDWSQVASSLEEQTELQHRVYASGLKVEGWIETVPDAGPAGSARVFHVLRLIES